MHKIGSIPFKVYKNKVAVLFVTSQVRGRWILPKGELNDNESHEDACHRETYNESGAKGIMMKNFPITKSNSCNRAFLNSFNGLRIIP